MSPQAINIYFHVNKIIFDYSSSQLESGESESDGESSSDDELAVERNEAEGVDCEQADLHSEASLGKNVSAVSYIYTRICKITVTVYHMDSVCTVVCLITILSQHV